MIGTVSDRFSSKLDARCRTKPCDTSWTPMFKFTSSLTVPRMTSRRMIFLRLDRQGSFLSWHLLSCQTQVIWRLRSRLRPQYGVQRCFMWIYVRLTEPYVATSRALALHHWTVLVIHQFDGSPWHQRRFLGNTRVGNPNLKRSYFTYPS